ncbi:MAG: outer membrane protein assembly factor BamD [Kiritimatiellae bacterium]|nr:outer membrane protein assembly factor BamD [Kiritimatiellia bacterium]MDD5519630.1 outer membrane protein assembly factor BamD [Kiritimatiellia bacterium]
MYKRKFIWFQVSVLWLVLVFQPVLHAQYETDFKNTSKLEIKDEHKKKDPGLLFHRPAKSSPAEQLEFANKLLAKGKQKAAMKQFNALVHRWHTSPEAPLAQLAYARIKYDRGDYRDAFDEYQYLVDNFAGQFPYEEALDKQFRIANYLMTAKRMKFLFFPGFKIQEQALPLFETLVKNAPNWKNSVEAQYNVALINEDMADYQSAISAYDTVRYRYPNSERAADASFRRAYCLYLSANQSIRDETLCRQALSAFAGFMGDYPKHSSIDLAREYRDKLDERLANMYYELAVFYDKTPGKKKAALIAYEDFAKRFPSSKLAGDAGERIDVLKKELEKNK